MPSWFHIIINPIRIYINSLFIDQDAFEIICCTLLTLSTLYLFQKLVTNLLKYGISGTFQLFSISMVKIVPGGHKIIEGELEKTKQDLMKQLKPPTSKHQVYHDLPDKGIARNLIREELLYQLSQEKAVQNKRGHGGVYVKINKKYEKYLNMNDNKESEIINIIDEYFTMKEEAYLYFSHTNTLYPFLFPGTRKFDVELISMASKMLHAKEPAGNITSGGTESIFLAMKCWRSYGEKVNGIGGLDSSVVPNVILPKTVHPAFSKACRYLQIETRYVDINTSSKLYGTVNLNKLEQAIDKNTICIVGSAPCFPYSVVDDIEAICNIAKRNGDIPVHVDNCLGGFLLSFLYDCDKINNAFDFRVDGVCSISCDMHKQAGSDKGCSAIIYNKFEYKTYQYYCYVNWPGGLYCSAGFQGSSNGGLKAVAWAMLLRKGKNKLKQDAIKLYEGVNYFREQINLKIDDCDVLGHPIACGVAFKFKGKLLDYDYAIAEALDEIGGWQINRLQFPSCLFFQAGHQWIDEIDQLIIDLQKAIQLTIKNPTKYKKCGMAGIYGMAATFPDRGLIEKTCYSYLDVLHTPY